MDFSETIAACDLKVGRYRQLIELMKVCEYRRSWPLFDIGPKSFTSEKLKLAFLRNHLVIFNHILYVSFEVHGNEIFLK